MNILFRYNTERGSQLLEDSAALFHELGPAGSHGQAMAHAYLAPCAQIGSSALRWCRGS